MSYPLAAELYVRPSPELSPVSKLPRLVLAGVAVFTTACGCDADLRWRFNPTARTLAIGESFTPSLQLLGCGGTEPLSDVITWTAQDSSIVRVDRATGRTIGLRSGTTLVVGTGERYHTGGGVTVTVVAR